MAPDGQGETALDPLVQAADALLTRARAAADDVRLDIGAPLGRIGRTLRQSDDVRAQAHQVLDEARRQALAEQERLAAKVADSHARIRALVDELDFELPAWLRAKPGVPGGIPESRRPVARGLRAPAPPGPASGPAPHVPAGFAGAPARPAAIPRPAVSPVAPHAPIPTRFPPPPPPPPPPAPSPPRPRPPAPRPPPPARPPSAVPPSPPDGGLFVRRAWARQLVLLFSIPGADPGLSERRRRSAEAFLWVRNVGVVLLLFVAYELWGTGAAEARAQRDLKQEFSQSAPASVAASTAAPLAAQPPPPPPVGAALAILDIPKIELERAVIEGTRTSDLRKGPGHYPRTAHPGQRGNVAIAGHRTTYGAPFYRLEELDKGDEILLRTRIGTFRYFVDSKEVVRPSERGPLKPTSDDRLTLTTCHPKFSASQRLIVVAKGVPPTRGDGERPPTTSLPPSTTQAVASPARVPDAAEPGDAGALLPTLLWGLLALGVVLAARQMAWQRMRWISYALCAPVVVALLLPFFEGLDRLLPASY